MSEVERAAFADMELQLRIMRVRVEYWKEDLALGLKLTEGSMDDAIISIQDCLNRAKRAKQND